jgi:hypothetical protein
VADAIVARGLPCDEIASPRTAKPHVLTPFAVVRQERVSYPGPPEPS